MKHLTDYSQEYQNEIKTKLFNMKIQNLSKEYNKDKEYKVDKATTSKGRQEGISFELKKKQMQNIICELHDFKSNINDFRRGNEIHKQNVECNHYIKNESENIKNIIHQKGSKTTSKYVQSNILIQQCTLTNKNIEFQYYPENKVINTENSFRIRSMPKTLFQPINKIPTLNSDDPQYHINFVSKFQNKNIQQSQQQQSFFMCQSKINKSNIFQQNCDMSQCPKQSEIISQTPKRRKNRLKLNMEEEQENFQYSLMVKTFQPLLFKYVKINEKQKVCKILNINPSLINLPDSYGSPLLHYAVRSGNYQMAKILFSFGADTNTKDKNNLTPLFYALNYNFTNLIAILMSQAADPYQVELDENHQNYPFLQTLRSLWSLHDSREEKLNSFKNITNYKDQLYDKFELNMLETDNYKYL